jgi:hypothetical protein
MRGVRPLVGRSSFRVRAVYYEVRVSDGSRFEIELDEPPIEGGAIDPGSMVYKVLRVLPGEGEFDGIIEVEGRAGPAEFGGL